MNFYNSTHQHYCGIDLHARSLYVCIINQQGETLLHKEIRANPDALIEFITPYLDDIVLGVVWRFSSATTANLAKWNGS